MEDVRQNIWLDEIAACAQSGPPWFCEITGKPLDEKEVEKAMLKEIDMINSFGTLKEATSEDLKMMRTIGTRWVITSKPTADNPNNVKARLEI